MSNILFKSEISPAHRHNWLIGSIMSIIPIFFLFLTIFTIELDLRGLIFTLIIFLSWDVITIWITFQFIGSYLIIYTNGVKIRNPFSLFNHKFISWSSIKEIILYEYGYTKDIFDNTKYNAISFSLKNQKKSFHIIGKWVDKIEYAYSIMLDYIESYERK